MGNKYITSTSELTKTAFANPMMMENLSIMGIHKLAKDGGRDLLIDKGESLSTILHHYRDRVVGITDPGIYYVFNDHYKLSPVIVAKNGNDNFLKRGESTLTMYTIDGKRSRIDKENVNPIMGILVADEKKIEHIFNMFSKLGIRKKDNEYSKKFLIVNGNFIVDISYSSFMKSGDNYIYTGDDKDIVLKTGKDAWAYSKDYLIAGKNHFFLISSSYDDINFLKLSNIDQPISKIAAETITLKKDGAEYILNGNRDTLKNTCYTLMENDFSAEAVKNFVKTAAKKNGSEVSASATQKKSEKKPKKEKPKKEKPETSNARDKIAKSQQQAEEQTPPPSATEIMQNLQQTNATVSQISQGLEQLTAMLGQVNQSNAATEQAITGLAQQEQIEAQQMQQQQAAQELLQQQQEQQQQAQDLQGEGMNLNIDPRVLQQIGELADKNSFDAAVLSSLAENEDLSSIISSFYSSIEAGAVGISKLTLQLEMNFEQLANQIGEQELVRFIDKSKKISKKVVDLLVDSQVLK